MRDNRAISPVALSSFFLQPVARHPQLVLLALAELGGALSRRRKLLLQSFDARMRLAKRAVPLGELLRKKPIFGGETVGSRLKAFPPASIGNSAKAVAAGFATLDAISTQKS